MAKCLGLLGREGRHCSLPKRFRLSTSSPVFLPRTLPIARIVVVFSALNISDSALYIPVMSDPGGRPLGSKNQPGHSAGGVAGAGHHLEPKKHKTESSTSQIWVTNSSGSGSHVCSMSLSQIFTIKMAMLDFLHQGGTSIQCIGITFHTILIFLFYSGHNIKITKLFI